ncbi:MAG: RDD family protein [Deltaproteobacteria bacterium]|nr:RDD family protein [Deltaproteobacteria bacterium]
MPWLWYVAPIVILLVYFVLVWRPMPAERRRRREIELWLAAMLGPLPAKAEAPAENAKPARKGAAEQRRPREVERLAPSFGDLVEQAGGGERVADVVLVPKVAHLAVRAAGPVAGSHHQTVVAKLGKPAPSLVVRPLPVVEGKRAENRGIHFPKDEEFAEHFVVEGDDAKAIVRWLKPSLRRALRELPEVWLRVQGKMMALTLYGEAPAGRLAELVAVADALFAAKGVGGGSLVRAGAKASAAPAPASAEPAIGTAPAPLGRRLGAALAAVVGLGLQGELGLAVLVHPPAVESGGGPWRGGWTSRGFGAFVAAEGALIALFVYQAHLAASRGLSVGKRLFGAKVVRLDGRRIDWLHGVFLRRWVWLGLPLVLVMLRLGWFGSLPLLAGMRLRYILGGGLLLLLVDAAFLFAHATRRCLHDYLAGTTVVAAPSGRSDRR